MNGKQHLVSGLTIATFDVAVYEHVLHTWTNEQAIQTVMNVKSFFIPDNLILLPICGIFYAFGLIIPDCDNEKSMAGRVFHIPIEHRTWLHTLWVVLLLACSGLIFKPFFCIAFGYFTHLFCDSFSKCGVCWLYPISNYKRYGHAKVKKGHFIYLYDSDPVAWIICGIMLTLVVIYILGALGVLPALGKTLTSISLKIQSIVVFLQSMRA